MNDKETIAFLEANFSRQLAWIAAAESKIAFAFTLDTAMLGTIAALAPKTATGWTTAQVVFAATASTLGLASVLCLFFASFPRTTGPAGSLLYFGGIAARDLQQFKDEVKALDEAGYVDDLATQCHRNGEIVAKKFLWVQRALIALYLALVPWGVAIYLLYQAGSSTP